MSKGLKQFGLSVLNIPDELKRDMLWAVSTMKIIDPSTGRKDKAPRNPKTGELLSVMSSDGWGTFEDCINSGYPAIGMRLTSDDPYTVIDLDRSKIKEDNEFARRIYDSFDSYTEKSQSGQGIHIIMKGPNEAGRRKNNVEIYSQDRYILCTGDVLKNKPIIDGGKTLEQLKKRLNFSDNPDAIPVIQYHDEKESDHQILTKMFNASNGKHVKELYDTRPTASDDWSKLDAQLAQHICFYTRNPDQALRLFRGSGLYRGKGQKRGYESRDKYENDYLVRRTFGNAWANEIRREEEQQKAHETISKLVEKNLETTTREEGNDDEADVYASIIDRPLPPISYPTGLVGDIAKYIYNTAPRPILEVSIAGALALVSGIAGRHYNINGSGLGLYLVALAKTGRGKEAASNGISHLVNEVSKNIPSVFMFMGPSHIASGQGLIRTLSEGEEDDNIPSKVSTLGEFGHMMKIICSHNATSADIRTRQVLLDLFSKNSWGSVIKESAYADKQNNTKQINSPNYAFLGDTTPHSFFKYLSMDIVNEGFVPRFIIVESETDRAKGNFNINKTPPSDLVTRMQVLVSQVITSRDTNQCISISCDEEAAEVLDQFDDYCDEKINADDLMADCWTRAHLQALRVAGVIAVGNNIFEPVVTKEAAEYAVMLMKRSVLSLEKRMRMGAFGNSEQQSEYEIRKEMNKFFGMNEKEKKKLHLPKEYIEGGYIPLRYILSKCRNNPVFSSNPRGATMAIETTLRSLVAQGDIYEVDSREIMGMDRKVVTRSDKVYSKGVNFDYNWKAQIDDINSDGIHETAMKGD